MQKHASHLTQIVATGLLTLGLGAAAQAQTYSNAVMALNPVAYWPLNETTQPPSPFSFSIVATNSGSLGAQGNGYYGAWYQPSGNTWYLTNNITYTNGIAGPGDNGLWCKANGANNGQYVVVPRTINGVVNSNITLKPPFTIEAWVLPNATSSGTYGIVAEGGSTVNFGGPNTNNPFYGGYGTGYAGVVVGQYAGFFLFDCFATNTASGGGNGKGNELDSPSAGAAKSPQIGKWNHLVCTYDGTTETMWINGTNANSKPTPPNNAGVTFVPDLTTPLLIGTGPDLTAQSGEGGIEMNGCIDEVAIYNEILPQSSIANHYAAYNSANYPTVVQGDNPILYYRFNDAVVAANGGYPSTNYPVATNYGTLGAAANGVYQPGTAPGAAGVPYAGFGGQPAVALNGFLGAVDVGGGSIPSALNPVGKLPFSVVAWFRGYSADAPARFQNFLGHGDASYRMGVGQVAGENHWNPGPGPELQFVSPADVITNHAADNDGNWHMCAGVTDGTNEYMYLDNVLMKSASNASGISITGSSIDLLLGGAPDHTSAVYNSASTDRTYDGQIAQVAIWTSALTAANIQSLYNAAGVPPSIVVQPAGATNNQGANINIPTTIAGSQPIRYQWYTNGTAATGQTNSSLIYSNVLSTATGNYYLMASSSYGSVTSAVISLLIYGPPVVQGQTQPNLEIFDGESPTLSVSAAGAPPIYYQWYSNGVAISGATNSSYTVGNVQSSATYACSMTNFVGGPVSTAPITLTALADPTAPYPTTVMADHPLAFWRLDENSGETAYDYLGGNNGTYTNAELGFATAYHPNTDPSEGNAPGFGIATTNNSYVGWVPANINFAAPTNVNGEFSVECWVQQYLVYNQAGILALGYGNGGEEFALDTGGGTGSDYYLRFYARNAAGTVANASSSFSPASDGAWHHVVGVCDEANGLVTLYLDGTNAGQATIPANSGVLTSSQAMTFGARQEAFGSQYDDQLIGAIDEVAVYNYALTPAQVQAHYLASGIAPAITQLSPSSQTVDMGGTATFTPTILGTSPLTYTWTDQNNNVVSTNATLVISNAQSASQGSYTLNVNNAYGHASGSVYLSVNIGPPQLVQDLSPATQTVELYSGLDSISYSIVVSGTEPFAYQWYLNGSKITGATNSTYAFTALPGTNSYYVTVTNSATASQNGGTPLTSSTVQVIGVQPPQLNPANYAYKVKIGFPGYTGHPLTNFPALITLNPSAIAGLNYNQFQSNGADLRFADASGTSMLPYEIDEWNDNGLSTIWVQIPVLNGTNIWAYWGNPNDTDVAPARSNVWTQAGYKVVYHLKEGALPFADSTGQYPATNGVAPIATNGLVGHGASFNGSSDFLTPGPVPLGNQFTAYAWININNSALNIQTIWANQLGGFGNNGFSWFVDTYNSEDEITHFDSGVGNNQGQDPTSPNKTSFGTWHFMVSSWDNVGDRVTNYLDTVVNGTGTAQNNFGVTTNQLFLGSFVGGAATFPFNGVIDEARIQSGMASTNWITTTYLNMADSAFVSYSTLNLEPPLYISTTNNSYLMSWPTNSGNFTLETTTSLSRPQVWTPVNNPPPVLTNGMWEQVVAPSAGSHFYRLQGQ